MRKCTYRGLVSSGQQHGNRQDQSVGKVLFSFSFFEKCLNDSGGLQIDRAGARQELQIFIVSELSSYGQKCLFVPVVVF